MSDFYRITRLTEVDSTNTYAKKIFNEGRITEPTVIVADTQTHGRGQMQTRWHDVAGQNLLLTIILPEINLHVNQFFLLNIATSLALGNFIGQYGSATIKWPNDILLDERKIGGILIENIIVGNKIKTAFIGIGINVNQHFWPEGLRATSLFEARGVLLDLNILLIDLLAKVQHAFQFMHLPAAKNEYRKQLYGLNQQKLYRDGGGEFIGKIIGINDEGMLEIVRQNDAKVERYNFKEIEFIFD